ncbi:MAG: NAD(P)-binding protein, partial [Desulfobacterales bacterium]
MDLDKCTSCGECTTVCPVDLPSEYDEGLCAKKATFKQYAQAIPGAYAIQKADKAPCRLACPGGLNVQGYVQMVKEGKYKEALEIIMEDLPLPGVLGRICPHGCEDACRRCEVESPVAIRDLKRLAADKFDPRQVEIKCDPPKKEKVAIIGSGPAGLSCAYHLAKKGILSTIFESLPEAGGMLRVGIPAHRLPREILDQEIEIITNLGVDIKTNTALGEDVSIDGLLEDGYKAVYLAIGAHQGIELGIPGEKANGVRQGVEFLREANLTGRTDVGNNVAIIGGGNVAIDVARSAVRLGAETVNIVYRRTRNEMPAWEEEIQAAEDEGVQITYLSAPQEVLTRDGRVVGLRCIRMELSEPDSSGRKRPIPIPGSEYEIEIDQLVPAIGQRPDLSALEDITGLTYTRWGTTEVDAVTYATERDGVFAGGDLQTGPWVAIGAIGAGKEAAESILRYIEGNDMAEGREPVVNENPVYRPIPEDEPVMERAKMPELPISKRQGNFNEVELGYTEEEGRAEAARCLNCGYCCECYQCVDACLAHAVDHSQQAEMKEIEVGSVILTAGCQPYDPAHLENVYHYKTSPNVLTSLEFERILSASGPTMGHLQRPSDGKEPKRIAWLQCVGSRDSNQCGNSYCSSVCCMYAIKDSMIAKEHSEEELDCVVFNMDIRTFGKDYEKYYNRAKDAGIRFVKSKIHSIDEIRETGNLNLRYMDDAGHLQEEDFDMVVLSVGLQVPESTVQLAERLGIELDDSRFAVTHPFAPVQTSRPGVYACGTFQEPKDIPSSVTEASAAACAAGASLNSARNTLTRSVEIPEEIDVSDEEARVGVFVCNCGVNISSVVDVKGVTEYAKTLPNVVHAQENLFTCSQDSLVQMKEVIKEHKLNRVVVAACTPKTHEPIFQDTMESCGLNKYLFEMANIRNQDSWVHSEAAKTATDKASDLVRMSVARATTLHPLQEKKIPVIQ